MRGAIFPPIQHEPTPQQAMLEAARREEARPPWPPIEGLPSAAPYLIVANQYQYQ
jgi:hypothetical protein